MRDFCFRKHILREILRKRERQRRENGKRDQQRHIYILILFISSNCFSRLVLYKASYKTLLNLISSMNLFQSGPVDNSSLKIKVFFLYICEPYTLKVF